MILPVTKFRCFSSGGEPLVRPDLLELVSHARNNGIRCVISTNGTMINADMAAKLGKPVSLRGVSLDGLSVKHTIPAGTRALIGQSEE